SQSHQEPPAADREQSLAARLRSNGRAISYGRPTPRAWPGQLPQGSSAREAEKLRRVPLAWPHVSCDQTIARPILPPVSGSADSTTAGTRDIAPPRERNCARAPRPPHIEAAASHSAIPIMITGNKYFNYHAKLLSVLRSSYSKFRSTHKEKSHDHRSQLSIPPRNHRRHDES